MGKLGGRKKVKNKQKQLRLQGNISLRGKNNKFLALIITGCVFSICKRSVEDSLGLKTLALI